MQNRKRKKIIGLLLAVATITAMIFIWPVGIIKKEVVSHNGGDAVNTAGPLTEGIVAEQKFVPQYNYIKSIAIDIDRLQGTVTEGKLHFVIGDENGNEVFFYEEEIGKIADSSFHTIPVESRVRAGREYAWYVYMTDLGSGAPNLFCTQDGVFSTKENDALTVGGVEYASRSIVMYTYGALPGRLEIMTYWTYICCIGILVYVSVCRHGGGRKRMTDNLL